MPLSGGRRRGRAWVLSGCCLAAGLGAAAPAAHAQTVRVGSAVARVQGSEAVLGDARVSRTWKVDPGAGTVVTTGLRDGAGRQWSGPASPDFSLILDGIPTSSVTGWTVRSVTAGVAPADPARPAAPAAVQVRFEFRSVVPGLPAPVTLVRTYSLRPGSAVLVVSSTLANPGLTPLRIGAYSLDELTSAASVQAEVQTYHGGSDWRQDFRVTSRPAAPFDQEGEVARFDDGTGAGWFFVGERRSGLMSRVGDAQGRTWVGVDNARDAFDSGPITGGPDYNRFNNPAYPVPARQRTVPPGGSLYLGRAYTGLYAGGADAAPANFVDEFAAREMPAFARSVGLNTFHPWGHGPGLSDANLRPQVDAARALGVETFMLDDQWQGSSAGDWVFDPARFPPNPNGDGRPGFVDYLHASGLKLGLWMSPLEFNPNSQIYAAHPEWACTPTGDVTAHIQDDSGLGVWDATNPSFQAYLSGVVDRLIAQYGVTEFKFDYMAWVDCPPHDYLDYEDAFVSLVHSMEARHPGVTFELDETNDQRAWPFESAAQGPSWFDNGHLQGSTAPARLLHDLWTAAPWLPTSSIGFGTYDGTLAPPYTVDYLLPMSLLSHFTFWTDLTRLAPADGAETAWWLTWYRSHRADLAGLVYDDTATDPLDGSSWAAFQPWTGGHGYVFAFRQGGGPARVTIPLHGVAPGAAYAVTDVRTGAALGTYTGRALAGGLAVSLAHPYAAAVLAVTPAPAAGGTGVRSAPTGPVQRERRAR